VSAAPKVLIIGLDAATPGLVEKWIAEDRLPNIGRFLMDGAMGPLNSVPNRHSGPAWSTMVTGLNPGKHGIYWFTEDTPETYQYRFINGAFRHGKAFWRILSEDGQRVGVVNVPLTYPAESVNGVFVAGLDSPSPDEPAFTYPSELRHEVTQAAGGEYYVHPALATYVISGEMDAGLDRLHRSIDKRAAVAEHLMATREWDAFMVVFTESDVVQHFFWRQMEDPSPDDPPRHRNAIRDTYEHLDRVVGRLMERAGDDTITVLVSDHGARYDDGLARALPNWLENLGLLTYRSNENKKTASSLVQSSVAKVYRQLDKRLPPEFKHKLSRRLPSLRRRVEVMMTYARVDWSRTKAYTDGVRPEIWINLRGRQSQGIVDQAEYERVRQEIIDELTSGVCASTGKPLVKRVMRREEAYSGPFVSRSPDLIIEWAAEGACLDVRYPDGRAFKLLKRHLPDDPRDEVLNGGHDQFGIVGLLGPGVRPGRLEQADIADIAPTVLFMRHAPIPSDVDGRVLTEALTPELIAAAPSRQGGSGIVEAEETTGYSEDEEAEIKERLQGLGYVE
jgi:predicted AlkP superfamily phosphohydrolase/phosphomutase